MRQLQLLAACSDTQMLLLFSVVISGVVLAVRRRLKLVESDYN